MTESQYQQDFPGASGDGIINPAGTRVYGLTAVSPSACASTLTTYDLTATPSGSPNPEYPAIGTPIPLSTCLSSSDGYAFALTPDGSTVFIAGPTGFLVQPITP